MGGHVSMCHQSYHCIEWRRVFMDLLQWIAYNRAKVGPYSKPSHYTMCSTRMLLLPSAYTLDLYSVPQFMSNPLMISKRLGWTLPDGRRHFKLLYRSCFAWVKSSSYDWIGKSMNDFNVIFWRGVNWPPSTHPRVGRVEESSAVVTMNCDVNEMKEGSRLWMEACTCPTSMLCRHRYNCDYGG